MATTSTAPAASPTTATLLLTIAQIGLGVLAEFATGGLAGDVAVAAKVTALVAGALPLITAPTLSGISGLVQQGATLLESVTGGGSTDAKLAAALLLILNAATAAVTAQSGQPINPALVPLLQPFTLPTPAGPAQVVTSAA